MEFIVQMQMHVELVDLVEMHMELMDLMQHGSELDFSHVVTMQDVELDGTDGQNILRADIQEARVGMEIDQDMKTAMHDGP